MTIALTEWLAKTNTARTYLKNPHEPRCLSLIGNNQTSLLVSCAAATNVTVATAQNYKIGSANQKS